MQLRLCAVDNILNENCDILIVGGGLTGALLHIALSKSNFKSILIDSKEIKNSLTKSFDSRSIALATSSVRILKTLDIWSLLQDYAAVIDKIHVSQQGKFGNTLIASETDENLGFVIEMPVLQNTINSLLDNENVISNATLVNFNVENNLASVKVEEKILRIKTKLIVAADGTNSIMRNFCNLKTHVKNFKEQALVTNIGLARAHANIAYERFTNSGPLALLPMLGNRSALVWSLPPELALRMQALPENKFLEELQKEFGYRLGKFIKVGRRDVWPLKQAIMPITHEKNIVFIGNAAHTLHPVAGQGFNLGLRDVATLAECIFKYGLEADMLKIYHSMREHDQKYIKIFTENLINVFKFPYISHFRGVGLLALDNCNFGKNLLERYARGFAGTVPDLVCGIALNNKSFAQEVSCQM